MILNDKQFDEIKRLNNEVHSSRNELLQSLCEALSEHDEHEYYMYKTLEGSNAWTIIAEDTIGKDNYIKIDVETFRFSNPTSFAIKTLIIWDLKERRYTFHHFDWYGNRLSRQMTRKQEQEYKRKQCNEGEQ